MIKKVIQQGRSDFDARSVLPVREQDKIARTPLGAFFNIPKSVKLLMCELIEIGGRFYSWTLSRREELTVGVSGGFE